MNAASDRMLIYFLNENLPAELYSIAEMIYRVAETLAIRLDSDIPAAGAEVTTGLRKLREAKDCFVLAKVILNSQ